MKLHPQLVNYIAETVIAELKREKKISVHDDRLIIGLIEHIIEEEMQRINELDDEVRDILAEHYESMRSAGVSYDEMFKKVKVQLAKEKGITL